MTESRNIVLFLLIFALFLGATIEISEGSVFLGILLFIIAVALISRIKVGKSHIITGSKLRMLAGGLILASDISYNILTRSELGTLDIMTFLLGVSLIAYSIDNEEINRMGMFGAYMSATFLALFIPFFIVFGNFDINFMHIFDHYFVLLPSVFIIKAMGIPVEVISTETVRITGVEEISVIIGGPCSGLYSMFLLIGIMVAYTQIENIKRAKFYSLLFICIAVAYLANIMRVTILYLVGFYYGKELMFLFHVHLGWIVFVVVVAVLLSVLNRIAEATQDST